MTVGTTVDSLKGVVTTNNSAGFSIAADSKNSGFAPYTQGIRAVLTTTPVTMSAGDAGVYWFSGSSAITVVMPDPSTCAGAGFVFRSVTPFANVLSGSGPLFIVGGTDKGARLTLSGVIGASLSLQSDGGSHVILGGYGTNVFA